MLDFEQKNLLESYTRSRLPSTIIEKYSETVEYGKWKTVSAKKNSIRTDRTYVLHRLINYMPWTVKLFQVTTSGAGKRRRGASTHGGRYVGWRQPKRRGKTNINGDILPSG